MKLFKFKQNLKGKFTTNASEVSSQGTLTPRSVESSVDYSKNSI